MKYKNQTDDKVTDAFEVTQSYMDSLWSYNKELHGNKKVAEYRKDVSHKMYLMIKGDSADLFLETPTGDVKVSVGDWILTEVDGDKRLAKKNDFERDFKVDDTKKVKGK